MSQLVSHGFRMAAREAAMRGVAYALVGRELLMKRHGQGISLSALSRQTGVRREQFSRWWKPSGRKEELRWCPVAEAAAFVGTVGRRETSREILHWRDQGWGLVIAWAFISITARCIAFCCDTDGTACGDLCRGFFAATKRAAGRTPTSGSEISVSLAKLFPRICATRWWTISVAKQ